MNNIKKIRMEKNFSQFDLAIKAKITPSDISKIENNKIYAYPNWRKRIADALEVAEEEIWKDK